jgi:hypothetical protein
LLQLIIASYEVDVAMRLQLPTVSRVEGRDLDFLHENKQGIDFHESEKKEHE